MEEEEKDTKRRIEIIDSEKRRYLRFDIHLPIEYDQIKSSITHTGNISEGGLLIYFPEETNVSQYLRLKLFFSLGSELNTIEVLAEVVWMDNHLSKDREILSVWSENLLISLQKMRTKVEKFLKKSFFSFRR